MTTEELLQPRYKEEWKQIPNYEHYEISNLGRVRKISYLRTHICKSIGYPQIQLFVGDGHGGKSIEKRAKIKKAFIHRLMAEAFIDNPNGGKVINHKDGNKENNSLENLEWCTHSENMQHAYDTGLRKSNKGKKNKNTTITN